MDWMTFKFCVCIWVLCVSKSQSQLTNSNERIGNVWRSACEENELIDPPDECNTCICFEGQVHCTHLPCPEQDCVDNVGILQPDACNKCVCRRGKVTCSNRICIPAPNCIENQLYPAQNECNVCVCTNGFISCTNNYCDPNRLPLTIIPLTTTKPKKNKECEEGTPLPGPDECTECFCENNTKMCKSICKKPIIESRFLEVQEITTRKPRKKKVCEEGSSLPGPDECTECFCKNNRKKCKNVCIKPITEHRFQEEPECVSGQHIPSRDGCNNCICFEGHIHCTHIPCLSVALGRIGPECSDDQPVYRPDECNECYCFEGRLECSDLVCIRGSKCEEGQVIPKPDSCNSCECVEGYVVCTAYHCPTPLSGNVLSPANSTELESLEECQEGDIISPPPPPNDCNTCFCVENRIICTKNSCVESVTESKEKLGDQNIPNLEIFDKRISIEPILNMLSKNNKSLTKIIHTHAYDGFHQEVKVHSKSLHKDASKMLKALATSLDNSVLANISQQLLISSESNPDNQNTKKLIDNQIDETSVSAENVLIQSSKLITSGSRGNETILVIPINEPLDNETTLSVLPLLSKYEAASKPESFPAPLFSKNTHQVSSSISQDENIILLPSTPDDIYDTLLKSSKFVLPGFSQLLSKSTEQVSNINTQPYLSTFNPKSINSSDSKISITPFVHESIPLKSILPVEFRFEEISQPRPFQQVKPGHKVFNFGSLGPIMKPNNSGQHKLAQYQFLTSPSKFYHNQVKPNQNNLPNLNSKGIPNNPHLLDVFAEYYKPSPLKLKPGQRPIELINNKDNKINSLFINFLALPALIQNGVNLKPTQQKSPYSQLVSNPVVYYKYKYESPNINEKKLNHVQLEPHLKNTFTEQHNLLQTFSKLDHETLPVLQNPSMVDDSNYPLYKKHTTIAYIPEYYPTDQSRPNQVVHQYHLSKPVYTNIGSFESDETFEVSIYNQPKPWNKDYYQFDQYSPPLTNSNTDQIHSNQNFNSLTFSNILDNYPQNAYQSFSKPLKDQPKTGDFNDHGSAEGSQSSFYLAEDFTRPKSNEELFPYLEEDLAHSMSNKYLLPQSEPTQNQFTLGVLDDRGSPNEFQYSHNIYKNPRQIIPSHLVTSSKFDTYQNHNQLGAFVEPGHTVSIEYPSNSAEKLLQLDPNTQNFIISHLKANPDNLPHLQYVPDQNQFKSDVFDNREVIDRYLNLKPVFKLPQFSTTLTPIQHTSGIFDKPFADRIQHITKLEKTVDSRGNLQNHPQSQFDYIQNPPTPGQFADSGSMTTDDFHYLSSSNLAYPKDSLNNLLEQLGPIQNQNLPRVSDDDALADGVHYLPNSVEITANPKHGLYDLPYSQTDLVQNQHMPGAFDNSKSTDSFHYPSDSVGNLIHPENNLHNLPHSQFSQHLLGVYNNSVTSNDFLNPPNAVEDPTNAKFYHHNTTHAEIHTEINEYKSNIPTDTNNNNNNPLRPRLLFDRDRYKPYSLDNPFNSTHQIPLSTPIIDSDTFEPNAKIITLQSRFKPKKELVEPTVHHNTTHADNEIHPEINKYESEHISLLDSNIPTDNNNNNPLRPRLLFDRDRYKPSSLDNSFNSTHQIPLSSPILDNDTFEPNAKIITLQSRFKPTQELVEPTINQKPSQFITYQTENRYISDAGDDHSDQMSVLNSNIPKSTKNNYKNPLRPWTLLDLDQYKPSAFDTLLNGIRNVLSWPLSDNQKKIANSVTFAPEEDLYEPSMNQNSFSSIPSSASATTYLIDSESAQINPFGDSNSLLPINNDKHPNYYDQLFPLFTTVKKQSKQPLVDNSKFGVASVDELNHQPFLFPETANMIKHKTLLEKNKESSFENQEDLTISPKKLNRIKNKNEKFVPAVNNANVTKNKIHMPKIIKLLSKLIAPKIKDTAGLHTTPFSNFNLKNINIYKNWIKAILSGPEEYQQHALEPDYPDVMMLHHEPNEEDDEDIPSYLKIDAEDLSIDVYSGEPGASLFSKIFNHWFKHRSKDHKEECGHGTQWISNCHNCSCNFGQAMCFRIYDCDLKPFGEPMTCKPYSKFKMADCYTCECSGDGVAKCNATDCNTERSTTEMPLYNNFFNDNKTSGTYNKLPKDCANQYPTCEQGTSWISSCHKCECDESGQHSCVKIDDCKLDYDSYGKPSRCKPNSKFYSKMNSSPCVECSCDDEGNPYCPAVNELGS